MTDATAAIRLLRRQFDFTPSEVARAWLPRLEALLDEIRADQSYPGDWIVFRVTGVAPAESGDAAVARGDRLIPALVDLIEDRHTALGPYSFDLGTDVDAGEAAAGLGISRRTLQRWRPDGLPMLRLRRSDGRTRVGVRRTALAAFAARHPERVADAARYRRIDELERSRVLEVYEKAKAEGHSTTAAIAIAADAVSRSPSAVRDLVRRPSTQRPSERGLAPIRRRRLVDRALERGVEIESIARRLGRSVDVVRRADLERRRRRLGPAIPTFVEMPNASRPEATEVFAVSGALDDLARDLAGATLGDWLATVRGLPELEDDEAARGRIAAMHFAASRARRGFDELAGVARPGDRRLDPIESDVRWWGLLCERSVLRGAAEGLRRLEQSVGRRIEHLPAPRLEAGLQLVLQAVAEVVIGFDPTRRVAGHSLDRAVALGVGRRLARESGWETRTGARTRGRLEDRVPCDSLRVLPSATRSLLAVERWWRASPSAGREHVVAGEGGEALVIRFGLQSGGRPRSLLATGRRLGVAPTRISGPIDDAARRLRRSALGG